MVIAGFVTCGLSLRKPLLPAFGSPGAACLWPGSLAAPALATLHHTVLLSAALRRAAISEAAPALNFCASSIRSGRNI